MGVTESRLTATADIRRIVKGEALTITVELFDEVSGRVLTLEGATAATASFPGTDAPVEKELGAGVELSADPGRLTITLDESDTEALAEGDGQAWQVAVTLADESIRIAQLGDALDVKPSLF